MILHDDPRLTRYAIGEMNDADRAAFEQTMTDADRAEADAIRALGDELKLDLGKAIAEPTVELPSRVDKRRRTFWMLAAAASVAVVGLTAGMWSTRGGSSADVAWRPDRFHELSGGLAPMLPVKPSPQSTVSTQPGELNVALTSTANKSNVTEAARRQLAETLDESRPASAAISAQNATSPRSAQQMQQNMAQRQALASTPAASVNASIRSSIVTANGVRQTLDTGGNYTLESQAPVALPRLSRQAALADDERRSVNSSESYAPIVENPFLDARSHPLSTLGVDVDTASYANVRRFLTTGQKPPADAVRIEELINYFPTSDAPPTDGKPFAIHADIGRCPWNTAHDLVRVALKAKEVAVDKRPPSNLVFLIDVSGSMDEPDKLPLVKRGLERLCDQLNENDRVAIVVYAGNAGLVLPSTNASDKTTIRAAIDHLEAGGSTNGGQGIELAYATAAQNFVKGGANRVILCTDGDFNVGVTDRGSLVSMIQEKAKAGVFLSVFGFGTGNVKDDTMEGLADKGNGTYAYVDTDREAHKVFVEQASGTLLTVAKDVKIQIEFNPAAVRSYRLIGYENRLLAAKEFKDDLKDAGDMGAGHCVIALYEIEPTSGRAHFSGPEDALKYQSTSAPTPNANSAELLTLKVRYKAPDAPLEQGTSSLLEQPLTASDRAIDQASADFQFDAAVAGFGMLLRGSTARGDCDWNTVTRLAQAGLGPDVGGHRAEFLTLVAKAAALTK